jgi:hypothetical protein
MTDSNVQQLDPATILETEVRQRLSKVRELDVHDLSILTQTVAQLQAIRQSAEDHLAYDRREEEKHQKALEIAEQELQGKLQNVASRKPTLDAFERLMPLIEQYTKAKIDAELAALPPKPPAAAAM